MKRPLAITIIAWVSIAFGVFFLLVYGLAGYLYLTGPAGETAGDLSPTTFLGWSMPLAVYWSLVIAVPIFLIVDGIFLLKGQNWARMLAVIWWAFALLSLVHTYGVNIITGIQALICLLVIYFLNTRHALEFFQRTSAGSQTT